MLFSLADPSPLDGDARLSEGDPVTDVGENNPSLLMNDGGSAFELGGEMMDDPDNVVVVVRTTSSPEVVVEEAFVVDPSSLRRSSESDRSMFSYFKACTSWSR